MEIWGSHEKTTVLLEGAYGFSLRFLRMNHNMGVIQGHVGPMTIPPQRWEIFNAAGKAQ